MLTRRRDPKVATRLLVGFALAVSAMACVVYIGVSYRGPIDAAADKIYSDYLHPILSLTGIQGLVNQKSRPPGDCGNQGTEGSRSSSTQERGAAA
jgi:hypothetical protein